MTSAKQQYTELLALTRLYLLQEHAPSDRILADSECYRYFKEYALSKGTSQPPSSIKKPPIQAPTNTAVIPPKLSPPAPSPSKQPTLPTSTPLPIVLTPSAPIASKTPSTPSPQPKVPPAAALTATPPSTPIDIQTSPSKEETSSAIFIPEKVSPAQPADLQEIWDLVKERLQGVELLAVPPNDTLAKEAAKQWDRKPAILEVAILSFETNPKHKAFLDNLSRTLKIFGISAVVVNAARAEQEKAWPRLLESPHVRLIISGGYGLYTLTSLMQHYIEGERSTGPKIGKIPLLMLSDAALYLKEPSLKPSLWKSLKEMLAISP